MDRPEFASIARGNFHDRQQQGAGERPPIISTFDSPSYPTLTEAKAFADSCAISDNAVPLVKTQAPCPLCSRMATVQAREDAWHVICPHCLRFTLDAYLLDLFESARQRRDVRILHLLPRLSQAARQAAGEGGRLNLIAEHCQAVASSADRGDR